MITPSHRTIKQQAARHGVTTTEIEGELFAAEEIPVRIPHSRLLFETNRLELPICAINQGMRFQDMKKMRIKSAVLGAYRAVEERHQRIKREHDAQMMDTKGRMAEEINHMAGMRFAYND